MAFAPRCDARLHSPPLLTARACCPQFEDFYEEVFEELAKFGHVEEMHVLDNHSDHMVGNVYAKFKREEDAAQALAALNGRFYGGRQLVAEFCPVTDFKEARCRQFDEGTCARGYLCNFMHIKEVPRSVLRSVVKNQPHTGDSYVAGVATRKLGAPLTPFGTCLLACTYLLA